MIWSDSNTIFQTSCCIFNNSYYSCWFYPKSCLLRCNWFGIWSMHGYTNPHFSWTGNGEIKDFRSYKRSRISTGFLTPWDRDAYLDTVDFYRNREAFVLLFQNTNGSKINFRDDSDWGGGINSLFPYISVTTILSGRIFAELEIIQKSDW